MSLREWNQIVIKSKSISHVSAIKTSNSKLTVLWSSGYWGFLGYASYIRLGWTLVYLYIAMEIGDVAPWLVRSFIKSSLGAAHVQSNTDIRVAMSLSKCMAAEKSSTLTVASLNICTFKDLYTRASLLPPYVVSPQYRVILVAGRLLIPYLHNKQYMHLISLRRLRSMTLIFLSKKPVCFLWRKQLKDFCGHSWPLHTLTNYLRAP